MVQPQPVLPQPDTPVASPWRAVASSLVASALAAGCAVTPLPKHDPTPPPATAADQRRQDFYAQLNTNLRNDTRILGHVLAIDPTPYPTIRNFADASAFRLHSLTAPWAEMYQQPIATYRITNPLYAMASKDAEKRHRFQGRHGAAARRVPAGNADCRRGVRGGTETHPRAAAAERFPFKSRSPQQDARGACESTARHRAGLVFLHVYPYRINHSKPAERLNFSAPTIQLRSRFYD